MGAECVQNVRAREAGRGNNIVYMQRRGSCKCCLKDQVTKVERSISYVKRVESKPLSLFFTIVTILLFLQIGIVTIVGAIENICKS